MKRQYGNGRLFKNPLSPFFHMAYYVNGREVVKSTKTDDEKKAKRILRQKVAEVTTGVHPSIDRHKLLVEELAADLLGMYEDYGKTSLRDVETRWRLRLEPVFGKMRVSHVTFESLNAYLKSQLKAGLAKASVNNDIAAIQRMFTFGMESGKITLMPRFPKDIPPHNERHGFLEDAAFYRLIHGEDLWFQTIVRCGRTFGWREQELMQMGVEQIANDEVRLYPGTTKNREGRVVPMTTNIRAVLNPAIEGKRRTDFVFTYPNGQHVGIMRDTWAKACCKADLGSMYCMACLKLNHGNVKKVQPLEFHGERLPTCPDCGKRLAKDKQTFRGLLFHDLRRTAVRNMMLAGVADSVIMQIVGMKTLSILRRYQILITADMRAALEKVEERDRLVRAALAEHGELVGSNTYKIPTVAGSGRKPEVVQHVQ